ncbi:MAG: superoxide dismutase [Chloroflexi bacterium]|nr:MAG: superoxide dismutase [Chloroflexota bacterium]
MRQALVILTSLIALLAPGFSAVAAPAETFPSIIALPNGFRPEGVVVGYGHAIYAGSLGTGAIYRADLRTGEGELAVPPQDGRMAVGLAFDKRSNAIFVAGGAGGAGYVYDAASGASLAVYPFTDEPSFVNDVVVTREAAYFTDSFRPFLYRVPLGPGGQLPDPSAATALPLGGDFVFVPDAFNANGIDATPDGKSLVIVNSAEGKLYHVDPATGHASLIDLGGGAVPNGDGILLDGKTLYVVQNQLNQIAVVALDAKLTEGEIVAHITDPAFRIPTTVAEFGNALYAVNARFDTPPTPDTEYEIVRVTKEK